MSYSDINARRLLAKKLFEATTVTEAVPLTWAELTPEDRRMYERDIEILFNPHDEEVREALRVLRWQYDGSA